MLAIQNIDETQHPVREIHTVGENKPTIPALMPMITSGAALIIALSVQDYHYWDIKSDTGVLKT